MFFLQIKATAENMAHVQLELGGKAPFIVMATQNPVEQEGTYALPEAQLDRFFFKLIVEYPSLGQHNKTRCC